MIIIHDTLNKYLMNALHQAGINGRAYNETNLT